MALEGREEGGDARRVRQARLALVEQRVPVHAVGGHHAQGPRQLPLVLHEGRGVELLAQRAQVVPRHALEAALHAHVHLVLAQQLKLWL